MKTIPKNRRNTQAHEQFNELNAGISKCATKMDLKREIEKCATKMDLKREIEKCATKMDLKSEIEKCATKVEMNELKNEVANLSNQVANNTIDISELKTDVKELKFEMNHKFDTVLIAIDGLAKLITNGQTEKAAVESALYRHEDRLVDHEERIQHLESHI